MLRQGLPSQSLVREFGAPGPRVGGVPDFHAVTRDHVLSAIAECDERGADSFQRAYGFGKTHDYLLWHDGKSYDSKAILGVAYKYATGTAASRARFAAEKEGVANLLRHLEFDVTFVDATGLADQPATGEWREAADLPLDESRDAWAEAARGGLIETAGQYHAVVTTKELATLAQNRTGIRTKQLTHYWIGDVLTRVAAECARRDEPLLSSLCVTTDGSVGASYAPAVLAATGEVPADADDHAAQERLRCYRHFGADLPEGGGVAALTPKLAATRGRERKIRAQEKVHAHCPICNLQLPATGICDDCN
ncbi:hypothetical protein SAMN05192576_1366 [Nocardioides szechwanensis]|uniref:ScoMcrA-like N-terminal head domain-containing protein n=1 Tax=Nocardioides szechwanensis TaxID=1005944 RepID=A0A1G9XHZ5_9ACTN|nr:hypothetical protein SAMN05192576_1366 [Nocardioides szechwanensis]